MNIDEHIATLITRYFSCEATSQEQEELIRWMEEDPENKKLFSEWHNIWHMANPAFRPESITTEQAHAQWLEQIRGKRPVHKTLLFYWQKVAAVVLLPLLMLYGYQTLKKGDREEPEHTAWHEIYAPYGMRSRIDLPDESNVWLNAGSRLKYPDRFGSVERNVYLSGEAYFEVESDTASPFIVEAGNVKVRATGTAFHVEAYENDSLFAVTMVKGKVDFSFDDKQYISLEPGERMGYNLHTGICKVTDTDPYKWYAWKDGIMVFRDDPLDYVFKKIGQTFNVDIALKDPSLTDEVYRATFERESLDKILKLLRLTAPIEYVHIIREKDGNDAYKRQRIEVYRIKKN